MHQPCFITPAQAARLMIALLIIGIGATEVRADSIGRAFTYQGRLMENGQPFNGTVDIVLDLYDAETGGSLLDSRTAMNVQVDDGLFRVDVAFDTSTFKTQAHWLELTIDGTTLSPRQRIRPAPVALSLPGFWTRLAFDDNVYNVVGGSEHNEVRTNVVGATISGGGGSSFETRNVVNGHTGTIGGGLRNVAGDPADLPDVVTSTTVGGGVGNFAGSHASTVAGGYFNEATGVQSAVGGGGSNKATGHHATIPGGSANEAAGEDSFAAGHLAQALHDGTFVWSDPSAAGFASTGINQFLIHAAGGVGINTPSPEQALHVRGGRILLESNDGSKRLRLRTDGNDVDVNSTTSDIFIHSSGPSGSNHVVLQPFVGEGFVGIRTESPAFTLEVNGAAGKPGGGSWSNSSDRRLKENIRPLNGALERLLQLRGTTFEYRDPESINELPGTRIGMIAQQVERVFPDWVDRAGHGYLTVTYRGFEALTVEALRDLRQEKDRQLRTQQQQIDALRAENRKLSAELDALRDAVDQLRRQTGAPAP